MANIPLGYGQINWRFSGAAAPSGAEVTCGFQNNAALAPSQVAILALDMWADHILANQDNGISLSGCRVKLGPNDTGPFAEVGNAQSGGTSDQALTPNTSVLVGKVTLFGGRAGRGRMFVPGYPETAINESGQLLPANVTAYQSDWNDMHARMVSEDLPPFVLHGDTPGAPLPYGITAFVISGTAATQRRRLRR